MAKYEDTGDFRVVENHDHSLLFCPFCGKIGDNLRIILSRKPLQSYPCFFVVCQSCSVDGPAILSEDSFEDAVRDAVRAWNIRAV